jgi:hypothetical protein
VVTTFYSATQSICTTSITHWKLKINKYLE